jgi:predicted amidohydrolase
MSLNAFLFIIITIILSNYELQAQRIDFEKYNKVIPIKTRIRIASISVIPDKWEKERNWIRIEKKVREAAIDGGAELVVTPEGALEGYVINEVNDKWKLDKENDIVDKFLNLGEPIDGPFIRKASSLKHLQE